MLLQCIRATGTCTVSSWVLDEAPSTHFLKSVHLTGPQFPFLQKEGVRLKSSLKSFNSNFLKNYLSSSGASSAVRMSVNPLNPCLLPREPEALWPFTQTRCCPYPAADLLVPFQKSETSISGSSVKVNSQAAWGGAGLSNGPSCRTKESSAQAVQIFLAGLYRALTESWLGLI